MRPSGGIMKYPELTIIGTDLAKWHWPYRKEVDAQEVARHLLRAPTEQELETVRSAYAARFAAIAKEEGPVDARCDKAGCSTTERGTRDELVARGWQMNARKGGKFEWTCPEDRPKAPGTLGATTK